MQAADDELEGDEVEDDGGDAEEALQVDADAATDEEDSEDYGYGDADWVFTPASHAAENTTLAAAWNAEGPDVRSSHEAQLPHLIDAWEQRRRRNLPAAQPSKYGLVSGLVSGVPTKLILR